MRSHEERVAETKRRIAKMEREKRLRRNTVTAASAVARPWDTSSSGFWRFFWACA